MRIDLQATSIWMLSRSQLLYIVQVRRSAVNLSMPLKATRWNFNLNEPRQ